MNAVEKVAAKCATKSKRLEHLKMSLGNLIHLNPVRDQMSHEDESLLKRIFAIPNQQGEKEQQFSTQLITILLVNGEVSEIAEADLDPSSAAMTVLSNTVTTDQLKTLQEMNSEMSIEFVALVTYTGTS